MTKEQFIDERTKIISRMLDNPNAFGIYPTTICFAELDDLFDNLTEYVGGPSWAQIDRNYKSGKLEHVESKDCWCEPKLIQAIDDYHDCEVWSHKGHEELKQ
jgi:hypothetical protein